MITITLNEESGITTGELSVFPSKNKITGFVNIKTNGTSWSNIGNRDIIIT